jgi:hypothetical protein
MGWPTKGYCQMPKWIEELSDKENPAKNGGIIGVSDHGGWAVLVNGSP